MSSARRKGEDPDPKGLYSTLGVTASAGVDEIRKAYRRLALQWHPDKNPDNPDATAQFQKISGAYEVLSDPQRREMYDNTGCVDAEELDEGGFDHAADLFAAFFGGCTEELDADEQAMFDEFLRFAGSAAFRRKPRRGKKGRGGRSRKGAGGAGLEQFLSFAMAEGASGSAPAAAAVTCPQGHPLKRTKADGDYECDKCGRDIADGKRIFDCRKCDFSMCLKCHKAAEEELQGQMEVEMFEAFCEACVHPVRQGRRVQFCCEICEAVLPSKEEAVDHVKEEHRDVAQEAMAMAADDGMPMGMGMGSDDLEAIFMMEAMEGMLGGGLGGLMGAGPMPKGGARRSRKKR